jgi:acetyl-CoA synthetase
MNSSRDRQQLLGQGLIEPPASLRAGAHFTRAEDYLAVLERAGSDPDAFWSGLARELSWATPFEEVGGPGVWFSGGRLRPAEPCLAGPAGDPALTSWDGEQALIWTRAELRARVAALGAALAAHELGPRARVLLALPRSVELVVAELACLRLGLTAVPMDPELGDPGRLLRRAQTAHCRAAVCGPEQAEACAGLPARVVLEAGWECVSGIAPAPVPVDAMHPAMVLHESSGRAFSLPAAGLLASALSAYRHLLDGRGAGDALWLQAPAHHSTFAAVSLGVLAGGGRLVVPRARVVTGPADLARALAASQPRVLVLQVRSLERLVAGLSVDGPRVTGPQLVVVEGESLGPSLHRQARERLFDGAHVVQALCRPELGGFVAGPCPAVTPVRPASVALPAPGILVQVVDERGQPCPTNYGGLLALKVGVPSLALELQRLELPLALGVRVRLDREDQLWTMGEVRVERPEEAQVATSELETMLAALDGVEGVAVVRYQAPDGPLQTWAFLQSARGPELVAVARARVLERFGAEVSLQGIQVVRELPYSRTGKLLRSVLRRLALGDTKGLDQVEAAADPGVIQRLMTSCAPGDEQGGA